MCFSLRDLPENEIAGHKVLGNLFNLQNQLQTILCIWFCSLHHLTSQNLMLLLGARLKKICPPIVLQSFYPAYGQDKLIVSQPSWLGVIGSDIFGVSSHSVGNNNSEGEGT